jgi:hypothetical protein
LGFLSAYEGTERIDLDGGYWIDIKNCLSADEMQHAEKILAARPTVNTGGGGGTTQIDPAGYRNALMTASIVDWNLDEDDGTPWALAPIGAKHRNIGRLPSTVYETIWTKVDAANERTTGDKSAQFRDETERSAADGDAGAAVPDDVPAGTGAVAAPGTPPGGLGLPPVA